MALLSKYFPDVLKLNHVPEQCLVKKQWDEYVLYPGAGEGKLISRVNTAKSVF